VKINPDIYLEQCVINLSMSRQEAEEDLGSSDDRVEAQVGPVLHAQLRRRHRDGSKGPSALDRRHRHRRSDPNTLKGA